MYGIINMEAIPKFDTKSVINMDRARGLDGLPHSGAPDYNEIGKENNRHNHFATQ